ncbi:MAG TPA: hypothetical protein VJ654_04535 [Noviherbaspirillum sp.]|nr:hypothetical protein [Noviherbaspirillum sp.]
MKRSIRHFLIWGMVAFTAAMATPAGAVRIEGMSATPSVAVVRPVVHDGGLEVRFSEHSILTIAPWPAYLPQRFGVQQISASRQPHPAGPVDRISFTRTGESKPWLLVGRGARRSLAIVDDWKLQLSGKEWMLSNGSKEYRLGNGMPPSVPVRVLVGRERWCIHLLESRVPHDASQEQHIVAEEEPQADWAAVRLQRGQSRCKVR